MLPTGGAGRTAHGTAEARVNTRGRQYGILAAATRSGARAYRQHKHIGAKREGTVKQNDP